MKYQQTAPGEERNNPFFYRKEAEKAFFEFIRQVTKKQAKGFLSEGEHGSIYSKKGKNGGAVKQAAPLYVLKYFDNDELTFAKAKSRLFVEGAGG